MSSINNIISWSLAVAREMVKAPALPLAVVAAIASSALPQINSLGSLMTQYAPSGLMIAGAMAAGAIVQAVKRAHERRQCLAVVSQDGYILQDASARLRDDAEIVLAAVTQYGRALEYASPRLRDNKKIVKAAIAQRPAALRFASDRLQRAALTRNSLYLEHVSPRFQDNEKIVKAAIARRPAVLRFASDRLQLAALTRNSLHLKHVDPRFQDNEKIVSAAVRQNVKALQYASNRLQNDKKFNLAVITLNPMAILYMSYRLHINSSFQSNASFIWQLISANPNVLDFLPPIHEDIRNEWKRNEWKAAAALVYEGRRNTGICVTLVQRFAAVEPIEEN
jgi:hypothetical protein